MDEFCLVLGSAVLERLYTPFSKVPASRLKLVGRQKRPSYCVRLDIFFCAGVHGNRPLAQST